MFRNAGAGEYLEAFRANEFWDSVTALEGLKLEPARAGLTRYPTGIAGWAKRFSVFAGYHSAISYGPPA